MFKMITIKRNSRGDTRIFESVRQAGIFMLGKDHNDFTIKVGDEIYHPPEKERNIYYLIESLSKLQS